MEANNSYSILICSQDKEASSHCASILRSQLQCFIDECLHPDFFAPIIENCPHYDVLIFINERDLSQFFKTKKNDYKFIHFIEVENKSFLIQSLEPLIQKIKIAKIQRPYLPLSMKYVSKFKSLPFDLMNLSSAHELKPLIKKNDKYEFEKLSDLQTVFLATEEREELKKLSLTHPETLILGCLEQSETANELFSNYKKITNKRYPHLNSQIMTQYAPYLVQAFKICEKNPNILSKIESHFEQNPYSIHHSFFMALTSLRILNLFNLWTPQTAVYMAFTAITHDLEITTDIKYKSEREIIQELEAGAFDKDPIRSSMVLYHGERMAKLIQSRGHFPAWVIQSLIKHHEKPKGSGFPAGEDIQHYPIESLIFIISHMIADQVDLLKSDHFALSDILKKINLKDFNSSALRNYLHLVEKLDIMEK